MIRKENIHGWLIVFSSLLATLVIWITTLKSYGFIWKDPFLFLSKGVVLPGTILMCWSFFLATRLPIFEYLFNGLDKTYHSHKIISITSFTLICLHPALQFFRFLPNYRKSFQLFIPKAFTALEFGLMALVLFITLVTLTLWIKIPYHIWKKTHELFIFVLLLALVHIYLINKQVHDSIFLMVWIYTFIGAAILSYIYTRFLYKYVGPKYDYVIEKIEKLQECWNIYLKPDGNRKLIFKPAQFIYISFNSKIVGKEPHPFSISSAPHQMLRLSIKNLGDYTSRLDALENGTGAKIWGPYGRFYEKYLCEPQKDAVMIAGGIGITPFLSLLNHEVKNPKQRKSHLFYGIGNEGQTDFVDEVLHFNSQNQNIKTEISYFEEKRLDIEDIERIITKDIKRYNFFLCGPYPMMKMFEKKLKKRGVRNSSIIFEDFNLFD